MNHAVQDEIRISEIFGPTIQGEGALIGQPTVFVRTGGCDYRCAWCDSLHAVDNRFRADWRVMTTVEVLDRVRALSGDQPLMVSLSGGNPAIQPLGPLIRQGQAAGYRFALEPQGSVSRVYRGRHGAACRPRSTVFRPRLGLAHHRRRTATF